MLSGLFDLPWWGYVAVTLLCTHVTIASVTIFLHRHQAHRALDLRPLPSHFFRFWLWLTTGMVTRQWAAVHRKHHARCETPEDPHSPQVLGLRKVLWQGAELYRAAAKNPETVWKYGHGAPDDWIERRLYTRHSQWGIAVMLLAEVALFGAPGVTMWAVQMLWIPLFAAGVVNGVGHFLGYRNYQCEDASANIFPWGILIGGEELHNNHHAYGSSAKLSRRWFEFDIGWFYIRILEMLGLAQVRKLAPAVRFDPAKAHCDAETLHAVITHRYDVLARYVKLLAGACAAEIRTLPRRDIGRAAIRRWLRCDAKDLPEPERARLGAVLSESRVFATAYAMRQELAALWQRSAASPEQLVKQLEDWRVRAEQSGIAALREFSRILRSYC